MIKKYILLKDLAYVKAGAIYIKDENLNYVCENGVFIEGIEQDTLSDVVVEDNSEWFKEIKEETIIDKIVEEIAGLSDYIMEHFEKEQVKQILKKYLNDDGREELIKLLKINEIQLDNNPRGTTVSEVKLRGILNNYNITKI